MLMWRRGIALLLAIGFAVGSWATYPPPSFETRNNGESPNFDVLDESHPAMQAAVTRAKASLPEFLALAEAQPRGTHTFAFKYGVKTSKGWEFLWVCFVKRDGNSAKGTIGVDVQWAKHLRQGDAVSVAIEDMIDWMYVDDNGRLIGNMTLCAIDLAQPTDESQRLRKEMRHDCSWLFAASQPL